MRSRRARRVLRLFLLLALFLAADWLLFPLLPQARARGPFGMRTASGSAPAGPAENTRRRDPGARREAGIRPDPVRVFSRPAHPGGRDAPLPLPRRGAPSDFATGDGQPERQADRLDLRRQSRRRGSAQSRSLRSARTLPDGEGSGLAGPGLRVRRRAVGLRGLRGSGTPRTPNCCARPARRWVTGRASSARVRRCGHRDRFPAGAATTSCNWRSNRIS